MSLFSWGIFDSVPIEGYGLKGIHGIEYPHRSVGCDTGPFVGRDEMEMTSWLVKVNEGSKRISVDSTYQCFTLGRIPDTRSERATLWEPDELVQCQWTDVGVMSTVDYDVFIYVLELPVTRVRTACEGELRKVIHS